MSLDFRERVPKEYQAKRNEGSLSPNLVKPTPASIRDECVLVFAKKRTRKDMNIIRLFVDERESAEDYDRALRTIDITKFKPLQKFLLKPSVNTAYKNIELLAWLMDVVPNKQPAADSRDTGDDFEESNNEYLEAISDDEARKLLGGSGRLISGSVGRKNPAQTPTIVDFLIQHKQKVLLAIAVGLTAGIGITFEKSTDNNSFLSILKPKNQCMYWKEDHYEQGVCDPEDPNSRLMNSYEIKLRKIIRWEAINESDIGIVHYSRNRAKRSFFTAGGKDPDNPNKHLEPMTRYMYNKYILPLKNKQNNIVVENKKVP